MIELPELVVWLISEYLSFDDLQNLRATCKQLKATIDQRTFRTLHILVISYPFERELYHTGECIHYANTLHRDDLNLLSSTKFKSQFSGLLKLTIYYNAHNVHEFEAGWPEAAKGLDLNDLNCFQGLVHLEVVGPPLREGILRLRNLKIACLQQGNKERTNFELDCPQLNALCLECSNVARLSQQTSSSLRHLYIDPKFDHETDMVRFYGQLKNLRTIAFYEFRCLDMFLQVILDGKLRLPPLKKIQFNVIKTILLDDYLRSSLNFLTRYESKHIELLVCGKKIGPDALNKLLEFSFSVNYTPGKSFIYPDNDELRQLIENPMLNCLFSGVEQLDLVSNESVSLARQLIGKLNNLNTLSFNEGIKLDDELFERLLRTCRRVTCVYIEGGSLKQRQLDMIPQYLKNVLVLTLKNGRQPGIFNAEFVAKFKNLHHLELYSNITKEAMSFFLRNCQHQSIFYLQIIGKQTIWIVPQTFEIILAALVDHQYMRDPKLKRKFKFNCIEDAIDFYFQKDLYNTPFS